MTKSLLVAKKKKKKKNINIIYFIFTYVYKIMANFTLIFQIKRKEIKRKKKELRTKHKQ